MSGVLYLVATPIGNLEDITLRALTTLRQVDLIACEDTRHTRRLLEHFQIDKPCLSYHEHNESARALELVQRLLAGASIALVSDAGTPLVADPGYRLVRHAIEAEVNVVPIPGASAILCALSASGLPTDVFYFGGFLPSRQAQRLKDLNDAAQFGCTTIFYEAPHRIIETLKDVEHIFAATPIALARELTKLHEELLRGDAASVRSQLEAKPTVKGEITLLLGKREQASSDIPIREAYDLLIQQGMSRMDAIKAVARDRGSSKREIYALLQQ